MKRIIEEYNTDLVKGEDDAEYVVSDNIVREVEDYLKKIKDPNISKEEWLRLSEWMRKKEEEDLNYKLARLEILLSSGSRENTRDPENMVHVLNDLKIKLKKRGES